MSPLYHLYTAFLIHICTSTNTYTTSVDSQTGEETWESTSATFVPTHRDPPESGQDYGTIRIGQVMSMEFDVIFHGRTESHQNYQPENFFRIGQSAMLDTDCLHQGQAYPAMWFSSGAERVGGSGQLTLMFNSGPECDDPHYLNDMCTSGVCTTQAEKNVNLGVKHHITISIYPTQAVINITGAGLGKQDPYCKTWPRDPTPQAELGIVANVWFLSDKFDGTPYNRGDATFSNIMIKSNFFGPILPSLDPISCVNTQPPTISGTYSPTLTPSMRPTNNPTMKPSAKPTAKPTQMPSMKPTAKPTRMPSMKPTMKPTEKPSLYPTQNPTIKPSQNPAQTATMRPSMAPSNNPTNVPSKTPTIAPTNSPTSNAPTNAPTNSPTRIPTLRPSDTHTMRPTQKPTFPSLKDGIVGSEHSTTVGIQYGIEENEAHLILGMRNEFLIGISAAVAVLLVVIISVIRFLCKRKRKQMWVKTDSNSCMSPRDIRNSCVNVSSNAASPQDLDTHWDNPLHLEITTTQRRGNAAAIAMQCDIHDLTHSSVMFDKYEENDRNTPETEGGSATIASMPPMECVEPTTAGMNIRESSGSYSSSDSESAEYMYAKGNHVTAGMDIVDLASDSETHTHTHSEHEVIEDGEDLFAGNFEEIVVGKGDDHEYEYYYEE